MFVKFEDKVLKISQCNLFSQCFICILQGSFDFSIGFASFRYYRSHILIIIIHQHFKRQEKNKQNRTLCETYHPKITLSKWHWYPLKYMCCDLAKSVRGQEHWLWDITRKEKKQMDFFCFLLFWESFKSYNFGTTGPIQVGFSANCMCLFKWAIQLNRKLKMSHVWLQTLDFPRLHHIWLNSLSP